LGCGESGSEWSEEAEAEDVKAVVAVGSVREEERGVDELLLLPRPRRNTLAVLSSFALPIDCSACSALLAGLLAAWVGETEADERRGGGESALRSKK